MMLASVDTYDYIVILSNLSTKETEAAETLRCYRHVIASLRCRRRGSINSWAI